MNEIVEVLLLVFQLLWVVLVSMIKAFLPKGVLPRKSVREKVVLITGGGNGIGRIMATEFSKLGCTIVTWDIDEKNNDVTKQMVEKTGGKIFAYKVDLQDRNQIHEVAKKVKSDVGDVDILINNAGYISGKSLLNLSDEQIDRTISINTTSHLYTTKAFLQNMIDKNEGHIVTIASIAGMVGSNYMTDYCASKHGAIGFHEALTAELHAMDRDGVKTTAICPYFISTGLFEGFKTVDTMFLPPLTPEYVVECIMEAVLTNQTLVAIPKFCYWMGIFNRILPTKAILMINDHIKGNDCMKTFVGRKNRA